MPNYTKTIRTKKNNKTARRNCNELNPQSFKGRGGPTEQAFKTCLLCLFFLLGRKSWVNKEQFVVGKNHIGGTLQWQGSLLSFFFFTPHTFVSLLRRSFFFCFRLLLVEKHLRVWCGRHNELCGVGGTADTRGNMEVYVCCC